MGQLSCRQIKLSLTPVEFESTFSLKTSFFVCLISKAQQRMFEWLQRSSMSAAERGKSWGKRDRFTPSMATDEINPKY